MRKRKLLSQNAKLLAENKILKADNACLKHTVNNLRNRCLEKDDFFKEMISDGLRHGSSLAAKHMSDLRNYTARH